MVVYAVQKHGVQKSCNTTSQNMEVVNATECVLTLICVRLQNILGFFGSLLIFYGLNSLSNIKIAAITRQRGIKECALHDYVDMSLKCVLCLSCAIMC